MIESCLDEHAKPWFVLRECPCVLHRKTADTGRSSIPIFDRAYYTREVHSKTIVHTNSHLAYCAAWSECRVPRTVRIVDEAANSS